MSHMVRNPEDRFTHNEAQIMKATTNKKIKHEHDLQILCLMGPLKSSRDQNGHDFIRQNRLSQSVYLMIFDDN